MDLIKKQKLLLCCVSDQDVFDTEAFNDFCNSQHGCAKCGLKKFHTKIDYPFSGDPKADYVISGGILTLLFEERRL